MSKSNIYPEDTYRNADIQINYSNAIPENRGAMKCLLLIILKGCSIIVSTKTTLVLDYIQLK